MKGLLRNNFYTVCANAKIFSGFMLLLGIFAVFLGSQSFLISYVMIGIVGFSVNAVAVVKNEFTSKWGKYKLTLPVRRADIVKSYFINQMIWLLIGAVFAGIGVALSWVFHGSLFDYHIDILTMFALGISISFFLGAVFFPLFYLGGEERSEVFLVISLLSAVGIDLGIVTVIYDFLEPGIVTILTGAALLIVFSYAAFCLSFLVTVKIFSGKEY